MSKMAQLKRLSLRDRFILAVVLCVLVSVVLLASFLLPEVYLLFAFNLLIIFSVVFYFVLFANSPRTGLAKAPKSFPNVSVIIPNYNSKNTIQKCIDSIKNISYKGKIQIIVVDDCSTDGSRELLSKVHGITLIKHKVNLGKSAAFNTALKSATGKYIIFIDSDSYPEKEILQKTMGYFEDDKVAAVTCLVLPDKHESFVQRIQHFEYISSFGLSNSLLSSISSSYVAPGPFTVFRREIFDEVGTFDAGNLAEDMEFGLRLKKFGYKIMTCAQAVVLTDVPKRWGDLFRQRDRWYRGGTFNFIQHKSIFFSKKSPDFGFFVMPFLFFTQVLTIAVLLRLLFYFFKDLGVTIEILIRYVSLGGGISIPASIFIIPPSMYFFALSYLLIAAYFALSFFFVKRFPSLKDLPALAVLIFIYPYFTTFTYTQSYFKEMMGVRAKWVRVST